MKLVWSPETALKAYTDTVKISKLYKEFGQAELISAMAGGWNPKLIVEAWCHGGAITTSVGLSIAAHHTSARHVCMVADEESKLEYVKAMQKYSVSFPEIVVGEAEGVMQRLIDIDFMVVDGRRKDFKRVLKLANLSHRGAVLVYKNASHGGAIGQRWWSSVLDGSKRITRLVSLPIGNGLDVAYVAGNDAIKKTSPKRNCWIKIMDENTGEEHFFRG